MKVIYISVTIFVSVLGVLQVNAETIASGEASSSIPRRFTSATAIAPSKCRADQKHNFKTTKGVAHLDFASHRGPDELAVLDGLIDDPSQLTPELLQALPKWIEGREKLLDLRDQLQASASLKSAISDGKINWLGVEYTPKELDQNDSIGRTDIQRFNILKSILIHSGIDPKTIELTLLMYAGSPARYLWENDKDVRGIVTLVPLDSNDIKPQGLAILYEVIPDDQILNLSLKQFPSRKADIDSAFNKFDKLMNDHLPTDDEIHQIASQAPNDKNLMEIINVVFNNLNDLSQFISKILIDKRNLQRVQLARNVFVAKNILSQPGNGWVSFGPDHEKDLTFQLAKECASQ